MAVHEVNHDVTFGDCDPAGIVFYPNIYSWLDRCFHDWLRAFGGHEALCKELSLAGIGLREAAAQFRRPMRDGDRISIRLDAVEWAEKTLTLSYSGYCGDGVTFTAQEQRALFVVTPTGIRAGNTELLRTAIETHGEAT